MQPDIINRYYVFLASPGDVVEERQAVRDFFNSFNRNIASRWKVEFNVIDWENYSTIGVGRPQELITEQTLEKFKDSLALVVGIMSQRFGSPTGTHDSGTEEEFEWALKSNIETGFPEIKWFFQDIKTFQAPTDFSEIERALNQWKKVQSFKNKLRTSDSPVYYESFLDTSDFRKKFGEDLSRWLSDEKRPWFIGVEKNKEVIPEINSISLAYYEAVERIYKSLDIRGIDNDKAVDIPLSDVYVRLRVIRDEDVEISNQEQDSGQLDIHDALSLYNRLVIVGDPGSGKSTFLKFIALILAQAKIRDNPAHATAKLSITEPLPIPLFISLWDLSDFIKRTKAKGNNTIPDFIVNRLAEMDIQISRTDFERILDSGNCCLLFDGLDEVPTEQGRSLVSRLLEDFVTRFGKNRYVVTSRIRGYTGDAILKNEFIRCDIQDFDQNDRSEFLKNWFSALFRVSKEVVLKEGSLSNTEFVTLRDSVEAKDRIRALAVNPLLMTVIAIVHWNRKRLPDQRVDLYDECVDVLLGQRKAAERVSGSEVLEILDETKEQEIQYDRSWTRKRFAEIAVLILQSGADEITRESVVNLLTPRFRDRGAETNDEANHLASIFLDNQELRSGLLVSRRSRSCRFVHLTFQEYLAAWDLANKDIDEIKTVISKQFRNPQWFEALQLLGGELAKSSDEKLDQYISYLLDNLGNTIAEQAPVIALCANIFSDVQGVADVKFQTRSKYTSALKGTLDAFKPDSRVPAKTQLEVLNALARLGASVKEHLIQGTKSAHFQVRTLALDLLIRHLSDDDLFGMQHIFEDRSREPIVIYLLALFERDINRAIKLLTGKDNFNPKMAKAIYLIFREYIEAVNPIEAIEVARHCIKDFAFGDSYYVQTILQLSSQPSIKEGLLDLLFELVESKAVYVWRPMRLIQMAYQGNKKAQTFITEKVLNYTDEYIQEYALEVIANKPQMFLESWDLIANIAINSPNARIRVRSIVALSKGDSSKDSTWFLVTKQAQEDKSEYVRRQALEILAKKYIKSGSIEQKILRQYFYSDSSFIDPIKPITPERIKECAKYFNESETKIRERFESLTKALPLHFED